MRVTRQGPRSHGVQGSVDPTFFEYAVHMRRLTPPPLFVSYSDFDPHFQLPSAASVPRYRTLSMFCMNALVR